LIFKEYYYIIIKNGRISNMEKEKIEQLRIIFKQTLENYRKFHLDTDDTVSSLLYDIRIRDKEKEFKNEKED